MMTDLWSGHTTFAPAMLRYRGPAGDNSQHAHAALQIVVGLGQVEWDNGRVQAAPCYIRPMTLHRLQPTADVELWLVEPTSIVGQDVLKLLPLDPIGRADENVLQNLQQSAESVPANMPEALIESLNRLTGPGALQTRVGDVANEVGISTSRLRSLARAELGVPLTKWRTWQALRTALTGIAGGSDIADAAYAAGFSDQAHLTRTMRATLGITPGQVRQGTGDSRSIQDASISTVVDRSHETEKTEPPPSAPSL